MLSLETCNLRTKLVDLVPCVRRQTLDLLLQALNLPLQSLNLHLKGLLRLLGLPPRILQLSLQLRNALFQLLTLSALVCQVLLQLALRTFKLCLETIYFDFEPLATLF